MPWDKDPEKLIDEMIDIVQDVQRESVVSLFADIIISTPVDSGRLRGNWFFTTTKPSVRVASVRSEGQAIADLEKIFTIKGDVFYLTNNLPYAAKAEFGGFGYDPESGKTTAGGYSTQAPYGMVRTNVVRWSQIVNDEARKRGR